VNYELERSDMHDRPTVDELLRAVEILLDEQLVPTLDGSRKYNARVASNVVRIVRRELQHEESQLDAEWRGFDLVLGAAARPASLSQTKQQLSERNRDLSERIREGGADAGRFRELVLAHVRDTVHAKMEVSNPDWLAE
jgi:hypothetical protein